MTEAGNQKSEAGRRWYPEDLVDEVLPDARASAGAWLIRDELGWKIDGCGDGDPGEFDGARRVKDGDLVNFLWSEDRDPIDVIFDDDGAFELVGGSFAPDATHLHDGDDIVFVNAGETPEEALRHAFRIGEISSFNTGRPAQFSQYVWSDELPYQVVIAGETALLVPLPEGGRA